LKFISQPINDFLIHIVPTQVRITIGSQYFKNAVAQFKDTNVMRTTTKVKNYDFLVGSFFVKSVRKCRSRWPVCYSFYFKSGNLARSCGCVTLTVVKRRRSGNYRAGTVLAQLVFSVLLHFLTTHRAQSLRGVPAAVNLTTRGVVVTFYHFVCCVVRFLF